MGQFHTMLLSIFIFFGVQYQSFSQLEFKAEKEGILLTENNATRFFYQVKPKAKNGEHERAGYVHPLYGLHGEILTEDFPEDHPHHHGIFWSWHQLYSRGERVGDPWFSEGISWKVTETSTKIEGEKAILKAEVLWLKKSTEKPILKENLRISYKKINPKFLASLSIFS